MRSRKSAQARKLRAPQSGEAAGAPDLTPQRERPLELDPDPTQTCDHAGALQGVCSITRRMRLMRSQECQRRASFTPRPDATRAANHLKMPIRRIGSLP